MHGGSPFTSEISRISARITQRSLRKCTSDICYVLDTKRVFFTLAIAQAHEQNNALIKADGGAVLLTEDHSALIRWMLTGPEVGRLLTTFEKTSIN